MKFDARAFIQRLLGSRIVKDSSVVMIGNWLSQALAIVISILLARGLGKDTYGLLILTMTVIAIIVNFLDIRTDEANIKLIGGALAQEDHAQAMTFFYVGLGTDVVLMLVTLAIVALLAPLIYRFYPETELLRQLGRIYIWTLPFATLESTFHSFFSIFKRFRLHVIVTVGKQLILLTGVLLLLDSGIQIMVWAYVAAAAFSFLASLIGALYLIVTRFETYIPGNMRNAVQEYLPFAFHSSLTEALKSIFSSIDVLLLGAFRPPGDVSVYRIAMSAVGLTAVVVTPVRMVIYPEMTEAWARKELPRVRRYVWLSMLYGSLISGGAIVGFVLLARWLVQIFYGAEYLDAASLIIILSFGYLLSNAFLWFRPLAMSAGRPRMVTFVSLLTSILRTGFAALLIWQLGATGAALAFVISMFVYGVINIVYVLPKLNIWHPFGQKATTLEA